VAVDFWPWFISEFKKDCAKSTQSSCLMILIMLDAIEVKISE
jgi:hypothetical protein